MAAPTNRQQSISIALGDTHHLSTFIQSGDSCAVQARSCLNTSTCRPDGSCGLQIACLIELLDNSSPHFPARQWFFQHLLTNAASSATCSPPGCLQTPSRTPPVTRFKAPFNGTTLGLIDYYLRPTVFQTRISDWFWAWTRT